MKKVFLPTFVFAIVASFIAFIYEPTIMYANNIDDFQFDFYTLLLPSLVAFLICFVIIFGGLLIFCKLVNQRIYSYFLVALVGGLMCAYIHGNFLTGFLPPLDGTTMEWNDTSAGIISVVVCLVCLIGVIICCVKINYETLLKYVPYIPLFILAMLGTSLIATIISTDVFKQKEDIAISTDIGINTVSTNENFMILLVDAVDSQHFNKIVDSNNTYKEVFKDFSYFPDTLSGYAFTRDSIPFIFSGKWNNNEEPFINYSTKAFDDSEFFQELDNAGYKRGFYDNDYTWYSKEALKFDNITLATKNNADIITLAKQEIKYTLFKYLPYQLKHFSRIDTMQFKSIVKDLFIWEDINFYNNYLEKEVNTTDDKYFQYIHLAGGHVPFDTTENLEFLPDESGTYEQKLEATMKIIAKYINHLKESNAYDNAVIVVMADHGFWYEGTDRQNPILYVKGKGETHNSMHTSSKQVSYEDLCSTFIELLKGKNSTEIFSNIPSNGRTRRYIYNGFEHEEHMIEYEQTGKAWDTSTLLPTGKEFSL